MNDGTGTTRTFTCPVCGVRMGPKVGGNGGESPIDDPLLPTPVARLYAVAAQAGIRVFDMSPQLSEGFAGTVAVGVEHDGELSCMVGLAEDLDDELRADVLAFGIAVLAGATPLVESTPDGFLCIGRNRLPSAATGPGHLAWHMVRTCGQDTSSATFELVSR